MAAFRYAEAKGLLGEYTAHMFQNTVWDRDLVLTEAWKYEKRNQFKKGSRGAYCFAKKHSFFEEACSHMPIRTAQKG